MPHSHNSGSWDEKKDREGPTALPHRRARNREHGSRLVAPYHDLCFRKDYACCYHCRSRQSSCAEEDHWVNSTRGNVRHREDVDVILPMKMPQSFVSDNTQETTSDSIKPLVSDHMESLVSDDTISFSGSEASLEGLDPKDINQILSELRTEREECIENIKLWEGALRIIT